MIRAGYHLALVVDPKGGLFESRRIFEGSCMTEGMVPIR